MRPRPIAFRTLLPALLALLPAAGLAGTGNSPAPPRRPNVLVLIGDDHAAYTLGCYGSRIARTPNLDRLAGQGLRVERAYCNSPVCTPSRQSFLTGRMPHAVGVTQLSTPLAEAELTLAEHLGAAGYDTAAIGKMHFNSRLTHGFRVRLDNPEYRAWLARRTPRPPPPGVRVQPPWRPFRDPAEIWLNSAALPQGWEADLDATYYADEAIRFLRSPRDRPFFLIASFTQPHSPFHFPIEDRGLYQPEQMPVPEVGPEDRPRIPLIFRHLTSGQKQGIAAAYYTSVAFLDRQVGRVLTALEESGQAQNTLVVYLGDHGYNLGHHGRFEKHAFNEEAVRVPLLLRYPGRIRPGRRLAEFVELVDLFPTVTEACGVRPAAGIHGRSIWPLLRGDDSLWRNRVVSVYTENEEAMVRTDDWKLIYCSGKRRRQDGYETDNPTPGRTVRLYDLRRDPGEMRDRSGERSLRRRVRELKESLLTRLRRTSPAALQPPPNLSLDEQLDWMMVPPEVRAAGG